jgi:hypothetical protein
LFEQRFSRSATNGLPWRQSIIEILWDAGQFDCLCLTRRIPGDHRRKSVAGPVATHTHFTDTILRAGLNYQFHWSDYGFGKSSGSLAISTAIRRAAFQSVFPTVRVRSVSDAGSYSQAKPAIFFLPACGGWFWQWQYALS